MSQTDLPSYCTVLVHSILFFIVHDAYCSGRYQKHVGDLIHYLVVFFYGLHIV